MVEIGYLTPEEWAGELVRGVTPEKMAGQLKAGEYLPWVDTLVQFTGESDEVLELGSGAAQNAAILALKHRGMTLLDWSEENVDFGRRLFDTLGLKGHFVQHDMTKPLPFEDGSFDAVFSCGVFEYFTDEEITNILKETARISRKRVIIMVPNARSIAYRLGKWYMEKRGRWHWGRERPFTTLKPYFRAVGMTVIAEFSLGTKHSLSFLTMRGGRLARRALISLFRLKDHNRPAALGQGYLLVTIADRSPEGVARA
jgi:SAM-dependent methyltransferase